MLVVGGGPAGSAVAVRLARCGHDVTVVEKRAEPRHKACGDVLSPRAVRELEELGIDPTGLGANAVRGIRLHHGSRSLAVPWPETDTHPGQGAVLRRPVLDEHLRRLASASGARVLTGHEATAPVLRRGFVRGATLARTDGDTVEVRSRFVVVADGANSRFGRVLGTTRQRSWPYGIATRTYFESPRTDEHWLESTLAPPGGPDHEPVTGLGWVNPVGDGTVNVGVGLLSTYRNAKSVHALRLLDAFAESVAARWELDPAAALKAPTRFRIPLGGSVGPRMGPTFLVVGDAGGLANPLNGDGVGAALTSARIAADVLDAALSGGNSTNLQRYPVALADEFDHAHRVGRLAARLLGQPALLEATLRLGMHSERIAGAALRIATGELRSDGAGAERVDHIVRNLARLAPRW